MAKNLKNINGRFVESDFENALIAFLEAEGWKYIYGDDIPRANRKEVLHMDDLHHFLEEQNLKLTKDEIRQIADNVRLVGADTDFATLHKVYGWMVNGIQYVTQANEPMMIPLIDFDNPDNNIFRVVNQFTVDYVNNGETKNRRPDVLLYVNGIPVCCIELKSPTDANATINKAWEQINIRY
jgi:type I restriction enzyme R subunit